MEEGGLPPNQCANSAKRRRRDEDWRNTEELRRLCHFLTPGRKLTGVRGALEDAAALLERLKDDSEENVIGEFLRFALENIPKGAGRIPPEPMRQLREQLQLRGLFRETTSTEESDADAEKVSSDDVNPVDAEEASSDDVNPVEWLKLKFRRQWEEAVVGVLRERSEFSDYLHEHETSSYLEDHAAPLDSQLRADLMDVRETGNEFHINDIVEVKSVRNWHVALGELARYVDWLKEKHRLSKPPEGTIFLFDEDRDDFVVTNEIWDCIVKKGFQERCTTNGFKCTRITAKDRDIDKLKEAHTRVAERAKRLKEKAKLHRALALS